MRQKHVNALEAKAQFSRYLRAWYRKHARDLPWRCTSDPYHIWLSEVMLQQTTVATVMKYFERFIAHFPDVRSLAQASEIDVLRLWAGLGYYRRARSLHAAAKRICWEFDGRIPEDPRILKSLPGIGRYTANAVACFAFGKRLPILEANSARVLRRVLGTSDSFRKETELWNLAEALLPTGSCAEHNYALMELGALVCKPRDPDCDRCPIARFCASFQTGVVVGAPSNSQARKMPRRLVWHLLALVRFHPTTQILLIRFDEGEWHTGLYGLPRMSENYLSREAGLPPLSEIVGISNMELVRHLGVLRFSVTDHRVVAHVWLAITEHEEIPNLAFPGKRIAWVAIPELIDLPIASPYLRALKLVTDFLQGVPDGQKRTHS